ncbi:tail fiber protein [bacterium]|nr:tail fiber protein [bacterium]
MKILTLNTNEINQNGYHINKLTRNKIGFIYIAPANLIPDDCLACDGYVLKISDYKKLYSAIGKTYNTGVENDDEFRIPDYNITGRFLQPGTNIGTLVAAGLPQHTHSGTSSSNGAHTHTRGTQEIQGSFYQSNWKQKYSNGTQGTVDGVFTRTNDGGTGGSNWGTNGGQVTFTASRNWTGATSSNGDHTHTITVGNASNTTYGGSTTVQPPSQIVKLCIKYK